MPTDLPFSYARIEEYIAPVLTSSTSYIWITRWIIIRNGLFTTAACLGARIVQMAVSIGTYENWPCHSLYH